MKKHKRLGGGPLPGHLVCALALGALFLLGGLAGCILAGKVQGEGGEALRQYLRDYLTAANAGGARAGFWSVVWEQVRFPLLVVVLGFTAIGLVGIPIVFLARGFLFAYSVSCLLRAFGEAGLLPALFLFGLPALLWAPALFLLGVQGLQAAWAMLRRGLGDNLRPAFCEGPYWVCCGLCAGFLAVCIAFEYFALPILMGACALAVL